AARRYSYMGSEPSAWTAADLPAAEQSSPSTYIGDAHIYQVAKIVTDAASNTYVTGSRQIPVSTTGETLPDIFVTKLDAAGNLVFTATFGGKGGDTARDLALDGAGNIYVAGTTNSLNFPLRRAMQATPGASFLTKLSPDGSSLLYSTYFGGTGSAISAMAVDAGGNVYLGGYTYASSFESTPGLPSDIPSTFHVPAFLVKLPAAADRILYAALLGGDAVSCGAGSSCWLSTRSSSIAALALDAAGNLYFAGNTNIKDLPTTPGAYLAGGIGVFAGKVKAAGTGLAYLTYFSTTQFPFSPNANPANTVNALAVDQAGNAYLAGSTFDPNLPATGAAYQKTFGGPDTMLPPTDGFVARLNTSGSRVEWASYLGRTQNETIQSIALDAGGNLWAAGITKSSDFPNADGWIGTGSDFLVEFNPAGSSLLRSYRFPDGGAARTIALDAAGALHLAGETGIISRLAPGQAESRHIFGIANAAWGRVAGRIAPGELISIYGQDLGPATPASFSFDSGGLAPKSLAGVEVSIGGIAAPVLYVSANQINTVVPFGIPSGEAQAEVTLNNAATPAFRVMVVDAEPQIFRNADGSAAAVNQDGTLNSAAHPAPAGSIISVWVTGVRPFQDEDGAMQTGAYNAYCATAFTSGGQWFPNVLEVLYCGAAPGMVSGVAQVNLRAPAPPYAGAATAPIGINAGYNAAFQSDPAPVYVK
ncbi:MAG TPA: SBBP repeat-containing protein, partial [Bryobacteraceae bacterium]|nr:SBBP repeat-containing protein [Bryobacteraceae bacterium]